MLAHYRCDYLSQSLDWC